MKLTNCLVVSMAAAVLTAIDARAANIGDNDLVGFEAGRKAVAAEVNNNFGKIKDAINSKQDRIVGTCGPGSAIAAVNDNGSVVCEPLAGGGGGGDITGVAAGVGLTGGGSSGDIGLAVNTTQIQARVTGTCPENSSINTILANGTVTCEVDDVGTTSAGVSAVTAGTGISTNASTGNVTISVNTATVQRKLSADTSCKSGTLVSLIDPDTGVVSCVAPAAGDIVSVNTAAASGLTGGAASGDVNLAVDTTRIQARVTGSCSTEGSVESINQNGTVICSGSREVTRYIQINPYGVRLEGDARTGQGFGDSGAIVFGDTATPGAPQLDIGFIVPEEMVSARGVFLEVIWMPLGTPAGNVNLRPNWGTIQRVGSSTLDFNSGSPVETVLASTREWVYSTVFELTSNTPILPGDAVAFGIFRVTTDTSTNQISIGGLRIRYSALNK